MVAKGKLISPQNASPYQQYSRHSRGAGAPSARPSSSIRRSDPPSKILDQRLDVLQPYMQAHHRIQRPICCAVAIPGIRNGSHTHPTNPQPKQLARRAYELIRNHQGMETECSPGMWLRQPPASQRQSLDFRGGIQERLMRSTKRACRTLSASGSAFPLPCSPGASPSQRGMMCT